MPRVIRVNWAASVLRQRRVSTAYGPAGRGQQSGVVAAMHHCAMGASQREGLTRRGVDAPAHTTPELPTEWNDWTHNKNDYNHE
jgi:hypothetical protein